MIHHHQPVNVLAAVVAMAVSCRAIWREYRDAAHCRKQIRAARRRIAARVRAQARDRAARAPNPGYDELRSPWFIGVMLAAVVVLLIDVPDAWPQVEQAVRSTARVVGQAMVVWADQA